MSEPKTIPVSPADYYPSPPTSPQPARAADRPSLDKSIASPKFEVSIDKIASKTTESARTKSSAPKEDAHPVTPAESTASDDEDSDSQQETLKLGVWKEALSLSGMQCGATKINEETCKLKISKKKIKDMEDIIKLAWLPNISSLETETHLDALAKLVHCRHHDHNPLRQARVSKWMALLPGGPRSPSLQSRLRNILGAAPTMCTSTTEGRPCLTPVDEKRLYCKKTMKKMIEMAMNPSDDDDSLAVLVKVLQYHMLCADHSKVQPYKHRDDWTRRINKFRAACQNEIKTKLAERETSQTEVLKKVKPITGEAALASPPSSPRRMVDDDPATYWDTGFETSRFDILGTGDMGPEDKSAMDEIHELVRTLLNTDPDPTENEVYNGFVYIYQVPGNDHLVKIGFTTRTIALRHDEWKKDCHREPVVLYPAAGTAAGAVPHAHRLERLVHAELREKQTRVYCERCDKPHREWFAVKADEAIAVVEKWTRWIRGRPYEKRETRAGVKWYLREEESKRLKDMTNFMKGLETSAKDDVSK